MVANTDMKYRELIKKRYNEVGNQVAKEQAQMQSDHRQTMDMVNHPPHYNKNGIETIDAIESVTEEGFEYYLQGNILKYLWRYRYKNGAEDLRKARWYLDKLIKIIDEREENNHVNIK